MRYSSVKTCIDYFFGFKIFLVLIFSIILGAWMLPQPSVNKTEEATFGLGCFWHSEEFF
jgi:hypothetical protein